MIKLNTYNTWWLLCFFSALLWSGISPKDQFTWFLEVFPALIAIIVLDITRKSFPLTPLVYVLILIHSLILMVGGHYTYAEVPLFDSIRDWLGQDRNNFDKVGHFAQGFIPALVCREVIIRKKVMHSSAWQNFFIVCFCLALSAFYELIEWWVAIFSGDSADAFLGTQGYVWDTQSDMVFALIGAIMSLFLLSKWHNKQLATLAK